MEGEFASVIPSTGRGKREQNLRSGFTTTEGGHAEEVRGAGRKGEGGMFGGGRRKEKKGKGYSTLPILALKKRCSSPVKRKTNECRSSEKKKIRKKASKGLEGQTFGGKRRKKREPFSSGADRFSF